MVMVMRELAMWTGREKEDKGKEGWLMKNSQRGAEGFSPIAGRTRSQQREAEGAVFQAPLRQTVGKNG